MYDELTQRVIDHVAQVHSIPADAITPESTFEELDIDSLGAMSLVADLEIEMGVEVPNEELLKIKTVGAAVDALARVLAEAASSSAAEAGVAVAPEAEAGVAAAPQG